MDVYQAFNPFALAALPHKLRYDKQIEDFEYTYEMLDFNNDSIPDIDQPGPLRDYVLGTWKDQTFLSIRKNRWQRMPFFLYWVDQHLFLAVRIPTPIV